MLTNEERIKMIHTRAAELKAEKERRRIRIYQTVSAAACIALVIGLAVMMPTLSDTFTDGTSSGMFSGSILSENGILGYIITGLLAFILGCAVTVFCFRLKKWQDSKDPADREDSNDRND